jgi:hypothetical protein
LRFCLVLRLPDGWGYVAWQESAVPSFARYTSRVRFEWDPEKEVRNLRKHGVSFVEASTVFGDELAATIADSKHSELELRFRKEDAMSQEPEDDDLEAEYDFAGAVRGKYYERYQQGTNVILLDPDVAQAFKDSEAVNRALRLLLDLAKHEVPQSR